MRSDGIGRKQQRALFRAMLQRQPASPPAPAPGSRRSAYSSPARRPRSGDGSHPHKQASFPISEMHHDVAGVWPSAGWIAWSPSNRRDWPLSITGRTLSSYIPARPGYFARRSPMLDPRAVARSRAQITGCMLIMLAGIRGCTGRCRYCCGTAPAAEDDRGTPY